MEIEVLPQFIQQLTLYAQYAAAAYCSDNTNSSNTKTLTEFEDSESFGNVAGVLAVDKTNKQNVLSFRETRSIETWVANVRFAKDDVDDICDGCKVHTGFFKSWKAIAAATKDGYNYGAPRVGNEEFTEYVSAQGANFRVSPSNDIVPHMPPRMFGYHQIRTADIEMINEADSNIWNAGRR
ncbi:Alpha/Beta hydrolase protein [Aspergillus alliaceus]|uniref:Alpha/Beta hydrolase protein n=1 Tax=Petromyces alliaceus TaxID=209559 RepID=A0A5N7CNP3_PETAA|nr:Alpha/Beta hydrolase protein [Aspergillus alliaceus]